MFGSLLIPGICAMISQKPISLSALVILRDVLFYAGALIVTVIFLADGVFYPLECCLLLAVFVAYIISIFLSPLVKRSFRVNKEVGLLARSHAGRESPDHHRLPLRPCGLRRRRLQSSLSSAHTQPPSTS